VTRISRDELGRRSIQCLVFVIGELDVGSGDVLFSGWKIRVAALTRFKILTVPWYWPESNPIAGGLWVMITRPHDSANGGRSFSAERASRR